MEVSALLCIGMALLMCGGWRVWSVARRVAALCDAVEGLVAAVVASDAPAVLALVAWSAAPPVALAWAARPRERSAVARYARKYAPMLLADLVTDGAVDADDARAWSAALARAGRA